jgi:hypothetical protein
MVAYILGAGASVQAGYPLAAQILQSLSDWLDHCELRDPWLDQCRNRIVQVRETFGLLDDFEGVLGKLDDYGLVRVKPPGPTSYRQNVIDLIHDCTERLRPSSIVGPREPAQGFYPQYLRSELIQGLREMFYQIEQAHSSRTSYDALAQRIEGDSTVITFNYDVALERAFVREGKWDIGTGYGFTCFPDRDPSPTSIYKLHGSVNWFQEPIQDGPPPLMFTRDLALLGYHDLADPRIGTNRVGVNSPGTLILPNPQKRFAWEGLWLPLWNAAEVRLQEAEEVFIHGYSMPLSDSKARDLLFSNIRRSTIVNIYCRSSSEKIAAEFRGRGFTNVRPFPAMNFETWVTSD